MNTYTHHDGSVITELDISGPLKARIDKLCDDDNALHGLIYDVIDGQSLFSQGIEAAFLGIDKAKDKPPFSALGKQEVITEAVNYAAFFIAVKGMAMAKGMQ